jgi:hypothetical protein
MLVQRPKMSYFDAIGGRLDLRAVLTAPVLFPITITPAHGGRAAKISTQFRESKCVVNHPYAGSVIKRSIGDETRSSQCSDALSEEKGRKERSKTFKNATSRSLEVVICRRGRVVLHEQDKAQILETFHASCAAI